MTRREEAQPPRRDWREHALCREEDPELFFPVGTRGPALRQIAHAKAVCNRCPVRTECLQWALATKQEAGVWGGASQNELRAARRKHTKDLGRRGRPNQPAPNPTIARA
ncbi:WhiB family transcriptional regulator [Kitasatospora sp. NPDC091257]|uniref:WhiB family transcriptional regulator n=1 Tax=unclassified Kitasatospora TaxID=2633591 RepID=UPI002F90C6EE